MLSETMAPIPSLLEALAAVPDRRQIRGQRYSQAAMLSLAVCAMLCGARSLYAIAQWGHDQEDATLRTSLGLPSHRTPSVATLFRVFRDLDVGAFEQALAGWLVQQTDAGGGAAVALDGKTLRGIHGEEVPGVHLVAAYATQAGCVLGEKGAVPRKAN
jgi:hypothetical protein